MVTTTPTNTTGPVHEGKVGRPSEFTPEKCTAILDAVKQGMSEGRAAQLSGIDPSTLAHWKARGRQEESGPYADFLNDLQQADAHCEYALLSIVRKAAEEPKHWNAAISLMERKWPKRWSKGDRGQGLSTEEFMQRMLTRQKADFLVQNIRDKQVSIQKELDEIGGQIHLFQDPEPLLLRKKYLEKQMEQTWIQLEWYRSGDVLT